MNNNHNLIKWEIETKNTGMLGRMSNVVETDTAQKIVFIKLSTVNNLPNFYFCF